MVAIPEGFLRTVAFLCVGEPDESGVTRITPKATAFMVATLAEGSTIRVGYFVTARHCIYQARGEGHKEIFLRINKSSADGFIDITTSIDDWLVSDVADVAALLFGPSYVPPGMTVQKDLAINAFPVEQFVSGPPDYALKVGGIDGYQLKDIQPRTGNEVYFVGLFSQNYGLERNLPVARFGHISRMPSPIEFEGDGHPSFKSMAYLAEFLSWGGHSGSPVFFWEPQVFVVVEVDENDQPTGRMRQDHGHVTGFLGLISHHYTIETSGKVTGELGSVQMEQNSGIAIVIPADEIRSLLDRGDAIEQRRVLLLADNQKAIEMPEADVSGSEK